MERVPSGRVPSDRVPSDRVLLNPVLLDRRNFLVALTGGAALLLFAATRNNNKVAAPSYHVPEVSVAEAKKLLDTGAAIAIDVRHAEEYAYRHLAHALLVPLEHLQVAVPKSLTSAKTRTLVVYCNRGLAHGPEATRLLLAAGFSQAVNLASGIEGWAEAGMPVEHGAQGNVRGGSTRGS
jgi:rhodanese-related sulfurtransferase